MGLRKSTKKSIKKKEIKVPVVEVLVAYKIGKLTLEEASRLLKRA